MEQLVVRLGANSDEVIHWIVWSEQEDEIIASGELAGAKELETLSSRAGSRPIITLVPTSDVLLKWVALPAKAGRKAIAAIPYMLEEEISGDINQQFFALGPKEGNQQAVAIVNKDKLKTWLNTIQEAGLVCNLMLPDVLALPTDIDAWNMLELGQQLLVRQDSWAGLQGETSWLTQAIKHQTRQVVKNEGQSLNLNNHSALDLNDVDGLSVNSMPLELPMKVLAQGALASKFNLLQGEFKVKNQSSGNWKKWRLAAALAVIALFTSLIDKSLELNRIDTELANLKTQIDGEYKRAFPNAGAYRNLKTTMQRKMKELEQGGGGSSVLLILNQLKPAFEASKIKPQTLRFDSKRSELRLQAVANNFEALDTFKKQAEAQGFVVEQGAINQKDNQVIGSLSIRS
ncbi:type II secretion system protein GspL [Paraglaciecola aquimarina]|uniref:Type II secretion system protein L n=1 Tax=Paraglaciecola algarum TaxID=3050085 RepID=A0ABS9D6G8_9ALTE|nr:type II secretion system protein GspL [Paraglaciecola sp. G1-23]MCF2947424.1 type II secretion system protein GspL [Paraglaciecola sp. G1-23]